MSSPGDAGYRWSNAELVHSAGYLLPTIVRELHVIGDGLQAQGKHRRLFDLGCGNGSVPSALSKLGWNVVGVDPSVEGVQQANQHYPELSLHQGSADDDLAARFGTFPVVVSLEVVEHVFSPRKYAETLFSLLEPGGHAIVSTPYHGYLKNLALALAGRMDAHYTALWENGHIKFWSIATLTELLRRAGLEVEQTVRVGRVPPLAKSMIAVAKKPRSR